MFPGKQIVYLGTKPPLLTLYMINGLTLNVRDEWQSDPLPHTRHCQERTGMCLMYWSVKAGNLEILAFPVFNVYVFVVPIPILQSWSGGMENGEALVILMCLFPFTMVHFTPQQLKLNISTKYSGDYCVYVIVSCPIVTYDLSHWIRSYSAILHRDIPWKLD